MADDHGESGEARVLRPQQAAAYSYRIAFGPRAGQKVLTLMGAMPYESAPRQPLCADMNGFSLHAAVRVEAHDRKRLKQLCRCITGPAPLDERVQLNTAGQVELKLKTPCLRASSTDRFGAARSVRRMSVQGRRPPVSSRT